MNNLFVVIFILFILFILYQLFFYSNIYKNNEKKIQKVESFQSELINIDKNKDFLLDDSSIKILLKDYDQLKNNI